MKKISIAFMGLAALFALSACGDPNEPPAYLEVEAPAWTQDVQVERVSKTSAYVVDSSGESVRVSRSGTDIGNGLTATRGTYDLYVTDKDGVRCNWNSRENLEWCKIPNPAYLEYHATPK